MTRAIYIIGAPGTGKSTLMAQMLEGWTVGPYTKWTSREMFGHSLHHPVWGEGAYLGHLRPTYPGTDALSMSVAPQANIWLEQMALFGFDWVFGEGARLTHLGFLGKLDACTELTVVHLTCSPELAQERRIARGGKLLSEQYCKITTTKAINAAKACQEQGIQVVTIDTTDKVPWRGLAELPWVGYHEPPALQRRAR